jgi:5-methyltetrahydropteroyltriglutamate--homocysteine methyltransferase
MHWSLLDREALDSRNPAKAGKLASPKTCQHPAPGNIRRRLDLEPRGRRVGPGWQKTSQFWAPIRVPRRSLPPAGGERNCNVALISTCLGHPRIGKARELKLSLERYWKKTTSAVELEAAARELRSRHWSSMKDRGIAHVPSNDFSLYDHMLDMAVTLGAVPERYAAISDPLERYFAMARGLQDHDAGVDLPALEMTKWFDTNYHYIVPELEPGQRFTLDASKLLRELDEARALGIDPRPVLIGPVTFLLLSKFGQDAAVEATPLELLEHLLPAYDELLALLGSRNVGWVQLDEPCLMLDLDGPTRAAYVRAFQRLSACRPRPRLLLATYFDALADNLTLAVESGLDGLHVDLVRAPDQLDAVLSALPPRMVLSAGVVDGRNVWRTDLDRANDLLGRAVAELGPDRVWVAPSCSLLHSPVDLASERELDPEIGAWLAFASQKLDEIRVLADAGGKESHSPLFEETRAALMRRSASPRTRRPLVRDRAARVTDAMLSRSSPFAARFAKQHARFGLPLLPTTTIGSFPQTSDVRAARAAHRNGKLSDVEYQLFLEQETRRCIEKQEALGLDVLVHGEFERTDMVEYFGEKLEGFLFTENGWVQSYGSRCVKPPILYGDVARLAPMTVGFSRFSQAQTKKPVKGMLTGPVTILQWSFVRNDLPRRETCTQIALALRDEVVDLETAGIAMIQVDEPAIREGLPLRHAERPEYLRWAVDAFRLSTAGVRDETQIHTHMCYSEFGEILGAVTEMDADVLSIETSRSKMELFRDFARTRYPNEVGPGVYDIHSPRVPSADEMLELILKACDVVPPDRLWVNPDCGLKTRGWPEVEAALAAMVTAAKQARKRLAAGRGDTVL